MLPPSSLTAALWPGGHETTETWQAQPYVAGLVLAELPGEEAAAGQASSLPPYVSIWGFCCIKLIK